ncbi:hypothetical protein IFM89_026997 [Coptis chinensis]|uniref:Pentatricopeptide repeat-containing protein n=1 Tax=Coptis chinensis TaxID=261450 RepID=A0A835I626_9MAGN|nr:hypothetical protein IFM89_026997 [Coptis chinensis]
MDNLVDMYARCGSISLAIEVFYSIELKDVLTWNTIITAWPCMDIFAEALRLLKRCKRSGVCPDDITFVAVLSACSHAQGWWTKAEISSLHEQSLCGGRGVDRENAHGAKFRSWGALLGGCGIHGNIEDADNVGYDDIVSFEGIESREKISQSNRVVNSDPDLRSCGYLR